MDCEFAIVADLLLDLFRHKQGQIIDAGAVVADYKTGIKKGQGYSMKQLMLRISSLELQSMIEDLL